MDWNGYVCRGWGEFNGWCVVVLLILSILIKVVYVGEGNNIFVVGKFMFF